MFHSISIIITLLNCVYLLYLLILFFFQFCLMIAFASLSGFTLHYDSAFDGRFDFFYFATVVSWLLVIALFLIFALTLTDRLYEKCGNINWNLVVSHPSFVGHACTIIYLKAWLHNAVFHATSIPQCHSLGVFGNVHFEWDMPIL